MKTRDAADWEELARRQPYFPVIGDDGDTIATAAFLESGAADVASLLSAITSLLGRNIAITAALDFGCGAGRLTLPLARRATRVVGCDIAPTILVHAREKARNEGIENVTFIECSELAHVADGTFDFVCSLLVLQHIRAAAGYPIIRELLRLLAPGGIAALQVTPERPGAALSRLARMTRRQGRAAPSAVNAYDLRVVQRDVEAAGARLVAQFPTRDRDTTAAVLIITKPA
jgi:2-polyprenyl-3-methyl-5-hydroxy-6-metoxy-1,4-benzoquinol methylase